MSKTISVPYLLSHAPGNGFKPGRGEAGWTVAEFHTTVEALAFMREHPQSAMRCWPRLLLKLS